MILTAVLSVWPILLIVIGVLLLAFYEKCFNSNIHFSFLIVILLVYNYKDKANTN